MVIKITATSYQLSKSEHDLNSSTGLQTFVQAKVRIAKDKLQVDGSKYTTGVSAYFLFICCTTDPISFMVLACIFCISNMKSWCWRSARLCFFSSISSCFRFKSSSCSLLACRYSIASEHFDLFFCWVFHPLHCL